MRTISFGATILALCAACGGGAEPAHANTPAPVVVDARDVAIAAEQVLRTGPRIAGTLQPREQATITAQVGGPVPVVDAELGDTVRKGQLLARIDPGGLVDALRSARARVGSAQHALQLARRQEARSAELEQQGALSQQQLEVDRNARALAQAQLEEARAALATAQHQLAETRIHSPLDGIVSVQAVHEGDVVTAGARLFNIIDPSSLRLEASVPSSALRDLRIGTPVEFQLHGQISDGCAGEITRIAPSADPSSGQIAILVSIPNTENRLLAG
ncbi:MAG TPA: efflux RND transporter periplasmic adaptor subunit, partial [Polyangiales bacterium]|nr:efflux RND transporter periplasmic adaptor subunit [Polyangiales bacterium]